MGQDCADVAGRLLEESCQSSGTILLPDIDISNSMLDIEQGLIAYGDLFEAAYHEAGHKIIYELFGGAGDAFVWKHESGILDEVTWLLRMSSDLVVGAGNDRRLLCQTTPTSIPLCSRGPLLEKNSRKPTDVVGVYVGADDQVKATTCICKLCQVRGNKVLGRYLRSQHQ